MSGGIAILVIEVQVCFDRDTMLTVWKKTSIC